MSSLITRDANDIPKQIIALG